MKFDISIPFAVSLSPLDSLKIAIEALRVIYADHEGILSRKYGDLIHDRYFSEVWTHLHQEQHRLREESVPLYPVHTGVLFDHISMEVGLVKQVEFSKAHIKTILVRVLCRQIGISERDYLRFTHLTRIVKVSKVDNQLKFQTNSELSWRICERIPTDSSIGMLRVLAAILWTDKNMDPLTEAADINFL